MGKGTYLQPGMLQYWTLQAAGEGGRDERYVQPAELLMKPGPPAPDFSELFSQKQNKNNPPELEDPYCELIQPQTGEDWIVLPTSEGYTLTAQSNLKDLI